MIDMVQATEAFGGDFVLDNFVRLFIIAVGITLALVCLRIVFTLISRRETERAWGTASFGFIVVTPAISGLLRFGTPLAFETVTTYLIGLICGIVALGYRITLSPPWTRWRSQRRHKDPDA